MVKAIGDFLRSQFSEQDGSVSNTRVCIFVVIAFASGWVTALVTKVAGPVSVSEIGALLTPLGAYITGVCGSLYLINMGANKAAEVLNNRAGVKPPAQ